MTVQEIVTMFPTDTFFYYYKYGDEKYFFQGEDDVYSKIKNYKVTNMTINEDYSISLLNFSKNA